MSEQTTSRPVCAIGGEDHGHPEPVICHQCHLAFVAALRYIARRYAELSDHLEPSSGTGSTTHTAPTSKPPLRTDVLSYAARGGISGILGSWVQLLIEERPAVNPPNYRLGQADLVKAQAELLMANASWLKDQPFAAEVVTEVTEIQGQMRTLMGETEPEWTPLPSRWTCPVVDPDAHGECGGLLRQRIGQWLIRCSKCRSSWSGEPEFEHLGRMLGCDVLVTVDQASVVMRVHPKTIERWIRNDQLPTETAEDGTRWLDKRDLALLVARRAG